MAGDDSSVTQLDVRSEYNENQGFSVLDKYLFVLEILVGNSKWASA